MPKPRFGLRASSLEFSLCPSDSTPLALPGSPSSEFYQSEEQPVRFSYPQPPCISSRSQATAALASLGILLEMQSLRPTPEYAEGSLYLKRFPVNWMCIKVGGALDHTAILAKRLLLQGQQSLCGNLSLGSCSSLIRRGVPQGKSRASAVRPEVTRQWGCVPGQAGISAMTVLGLPH